MKSEELKHKLCQQCNKQFSDEPCEPSECGLLAVIENAVEIPNCRECFYAYGNADYTHCEGCIANAPNKFVSI